MNRPYLPEPDAPPPARPKNPLRVLALWIVLILMFFAIWQFLSPGPKPGADAPPPLPACETNVWTTVLTTFVPLAIVGLIVWALFIRPLRGSLKFVGLQEKPALALAERRFADALEGYRELREKYRSSPMYRAASDIHVGWAAMWSGHLDDAIASFIAAERTKRTVFTTTVRLNAACELAIAYALSGELETSRTWIEESRRRLAKSNDERISHAARLCFAEAIVMCRSGDARSAIAHLESNWPRLRHSQTANWMRTIEVVRAFAEAQGELREQNVVAERLVRVEPVIGGELAFLGVKWPEMHAFLAAHHLGANPEIVR